MTADRAPDSRIASMLADRSTASLLLWSSIGFCAMLALAVVARLHYRDALHTELLALPADAVPGHPALMASAQSVAAPLFAARCAACHGSTMDGDVAIGAPDLRDSSWLFGTGRVSDIERTILYGVRAGGRGRNVTEMPAFGLTGLLTAPQIHDVVTYLLELNGRSNDANGAAEGRAVYFGKGGCSDCHGGDAMGNADYGAPNLASNSFSNGGSEAALYGSIYNGRHNMMPGFAGVLSLGQIRALAASIYAASHRVRIPGTEPAGAGS